MMFVAGSLVFPRRIASPREDLRLRVYNIGAPVALRPRVVGKRGDYLKRRIVLLSIALKSLRSICHSVKRIPGAVRARKRLARNTVPTVPK